MKTTLICFFLLLTFFGFSQDKKFHFGIKINSFYNEDLYINDGNLNNRVEEIIKENEIGRISYSGSVFVSRSLSKRLSLSLGIGYMVNGMQTKLFSNFTTIDGSPANDPLFPKSFHASYHRHHIEIPFNFNFKLNKRLEVLAGLNTTINIQNLQKTTLIYNNGGKEITIRPSDLDSFRKINVYSTLGFNYDFISKEKISIFVQPFFQVALLKTFIDVPLNRRPMHFGISLGVRI